MTGYYDPHGRAKRTPDPYGRAIGESYRDACERMLGQLRAQEADLERLRAMEQRARRFADDPPLDDESNRVARVILGEPPS
jgi:hypothetical protein